MGLCTRYTTADILTVVARGALVPPYDRGRPHSQVQDVSDVTANLVLACAGSVNYASISHAIAGESTRRFDKKNQSITRCQHTKVDSSSNSDG